MTYLEALTFTAKGLATASPISGGWAEIFAFSLLAAFFALSYQFKLFERRGEPKGAAEASRSNTKPTPQAKDYVEKPSLQLKVEAPKQVEGEVQKPPAAPPSNPPKTGISSQSIATNHRASENEALPQKENSLLINESEVLTQASEELSLQESSPSTQRDEEAQIEFEKALQLQANRLEAELEEKKN